MRLGPDQILFFHKLLVIILFSHSLGICLRIFKPLKNKCLSNIWKQMLEKMMANFSFYVGEFFVCDIEWETGQMISKHHHWNILTPWNTYFQREILNTVEFVFPPLWGKENIFLFFSLIFFKKQLKRIHAYFLSRIVFFFFHPVCIFESKGCFFPRQHILDVICCF